MRCERFGLLLFALVLSCGPRGGRHHPRVDDEPSGGLVEVETPFEANPSDPLVPAAEGADCGLRYQELPFDNHYEYAYGLGASEVDATGNRSIVSSDAMLGVSWYEFAEDGTFTRHWIYRPQGVTFPERLAVDDLNGDGRSDVIFVENVDGAILWLEHPGPEGARGLWPVHKITDDFSRAVEVDVVDVDGDGRKDVVAASWIGGEYAWFRNSGGTSWDKYLIDWDLQESRTVRIADFNGDGRPDLLGSDRFGRQVMWYENPDTLGHGRWPRHVIDGESIGPVHGVAQDMDMDGDVDVVMPFAPELVALGQLEHEIGSINWYENQQNGATWIKHAVCEHCPLATDAVAGDLDLDGRPEVIGAMTGRNGSVAWFSEHDSEDHDGTKVWRRHTLKAPWNRASQVMLIDADGDGGPDIAGVATGENAASLILWRNQGVQCTPEPGADGALVVAGR